MQQLRKLGAKVTAKSHRTNVSSHSLPRRVGTSGQVMARKGLSAAKSTNGPSRMISHHASTRICRYPSNQYNRTTRLMSSSATRLSNWAHLENAPLDGNHATAAAFEADTSPLKVNLGRGVYKDDKGKSWILPSVKMAEEIIQKKNAGHEYLPFSGLKEYVKVTQEFVFGKDSSVLKNKRAASVQTISGTGALRVGGEFLGRFHAQKKKAGQLPRMFIPEPTYVNHLAVFPNSGFELGTYAYYDAKTNSLDYDNMLKDLSAAPEGSVVLLHACAHNPTGIDPTHEQWKGISKVMKQKNHLPFFDSAYQGFASGDPDHDAFSFRQFLEDGHQFVLAQSWAKNMGLYGQRIGSLHVVTNNEDETARVLSNLNQVIRPMYSNPPLHGAQIVSTIFGDPTLAAQWREDVRTMASRIIGARKALVDNLEALGSRRNWRHITNQIGMFAYSGLSEAEVRGLRDRHVYMNLDGRMSISGINSGNVEYLAKSMHEVTK